MHRLPRRPRARATCRCCGSSRTRRRCRCTRREQYQSGLALHRRAQQLYDEATAQAQDLAVRTAELREVETAAARRPAARGHRRRAAPDRPRAARQRHPVRPLGGHGRRDRPRRGRAPRVGRRRRSTSGCRPRRGCHSRRSSSCGGRSTRCTSRIRDTVKTLPELLAEVAPPPQPAASGPAAGRGRRASALAGDADHEIARAVGRGAVQRRDPRAGQPGRSSGCATSRPDHGRGRRRRRRRPGRPEPPAAPDAGSSMADGRHRGLVNIDSRTRRPGRQPSRSAGPGSAACASRCACPLPPRRDATGPALIDRPRPDRPAPQEA